MSAVLLILAAGFNLYALVNMWKRPGFFASTILCSYGLASFFGPSGTVAAALAVLAVAGARLAGMPTQRGMATAEVPLLLFSVMMFGSVIFSPQLDVTMTYASSLIGLSLITYFYGRTFANHPTFVADFFWGSAINTSLTFFQLIRTSNKLQRIGTSTDAGIGPIGLANLCEIGFVGALAILMFDRNAKLETRLLLLLFLGAVVLPFIMTTGTRSVLVSCGVVFIIFGAIFIWHSTPRARLMFAGATVVGLPAIAAALIAFAPRKLLILIAQGVFRVNGAAYGSFVGGRSTAERYESYATAYNLFKESPVLGTGLGSYGYLADGIPGVYPHNIELELMVSGGIVGTVLFFLFLAPPFAAALRELRRQPPRWDRMAIAGMLISTFIRHQFSFTFAAGKILFFTTGCFVAWFLAERQATQPSPNTGTQPVAASG